MTTWLQKIRPFHVSPHASGQHLPSVVNENGIKDASLKQGKYIHSIREIARITMEFKYSSCSEAALEPQPLECYWIVFSPAYMYIRQVSTASLQYRLALLLEQED